LSKFTFIFVLALTALAQETPPPPADPAVQNDARPIIPPLHTSIVITATPVEPAIDRRNSEVFERTLFSRDDQIFLVL